MASTGRRRGPETSTSSFTRTRARPSCTPGSTAAWSAEWWAWPRTLLQRVHGGAEDKAFPRKHDGARCNWWSRRAALVAANYAMAVGEGHIIYNPVNNSQASSNVSRMGHLLFNAAVFTRILDDPNVYSQSVFKCLRTHLRIASLTAGTADVGLPRVVPLGRAQSR